MRISTFFIVVFGVVLPAATLAVELELRLCKMFLFDPIPTPLYAGLVALVPIINLILLLRTRSKELNPNLPDFILVATVITICAGFSYVFIPSLPIAVAGFMVGVGLLVFAPLISMFSSVGLLVRLLKGYNASGVKFSIWTTGGACMIYCCIAGVLWNSFIGDHFTYYVIP